MTSSVAMRWGRSGWAGRSATESATGGNVLTQCARPARPISTLGCDATSAEIARTRTKKNPSKTNLIQVNQSEIFFGKSSGRRKIIWMLLVWSKLRENGCARRNRPSVVGGAKATKSWERRPHPHGNQSLNHGRARAGAGPEGFCQRPACGRLRGGRVGHFATGILPSAGLCMDG